MHPPHREVARSGTWYRQPVLWLGALIFVASLVGCVWMIVLGAHHADEPLSDTGATILGMPLRDGSTPAAPSHAQQP